MIWLLFATLLDSRAVDECQDTCLVLDMDYVRVEDCYCVCYDPVEKTEEHIERPYCE